MVSIILFLQFMLEQIADSTKPINFSSSFLLFLRKKNMITDEYVWLYTYKIYTMFIIQHLQLISEHISLAEQNGSDQVFIVPTMLLLTHKSFRSIITSINKSMWLLLTLKKLQIELIKMYCGNYIMIIPITIYMNYTCQKTIKNT